MGTGISVAMLTHDEAVEFDRLMKALEPARHVFDEIVVVDDFSGPAFCAVLEEHARRLPIRVIKHPLKGNFAAQRNFMKANCKGRYIFFLDPDELPTQRLLLGLPKIFAMMDERDIDACQLPRLNILLDSTDTGDGTVASLDPSTFMMRFWEDQTRLLRNLPHLYWRKRLDEYLACIRRGYRFPREEGYALTHLKTYSRGTVQRKFYRSIRFWRLSKFMNSVWKRLPWNKPPQWIEMPPPI